MSCDVCKNCGCKKPQEGYKYRNLPGDIQPNDKLWCVVGWDQLEGSSGVLEWARDKTDAETVISAMMEWPSRFDVQAMSYLEFRAK